MVLNYIWIAFFLIAFVVAAAKSLFFGEIGIYSNIIESAFAAAKNGFEISLGLTGVLAMWLGLMKIGERGGVIELFSRLISPLFTKLFPDLPKNHPACGSIFMNLSANMLGLDNAATPLGLKAMKEMQEVNLDKERASNPMIMFLVLNTSGLTLVPVSIMVYRTQLGAAHPSDIFLPILLATLCSTIAGTILVCLKQRIDIFQRSIIIFLAGFISLIGGIILLFSQMSDTQMSIYSTFGANFLLFTIIAGFIFAGARRKINVYDAFVEGAKDGFQTAITIIPYLIAILVGIAVFRASGAMDSVINAIKYLFDAIGVNSEFVEALPTALMKPLSGSGARGLMVDTITQHGADSFIGRMVSVVQGSTDTTFYILAVYFGSVGIKNSRYALGAGLFADAIGIIAAIAISYFFFH
ncbi:MAG: nucleoside recognition domain-containing protein [Bacteroidales bacterium]